MKTETTLRPDGPHRRPVSFAGISLMLVIMLIIASCATTDELKDDEMERLLDEATEEYGDLAEYMDERDTYEEALDGEALEELEARAEELLSELPELSVNLERHRSRLSDHHAVLRNDIPEVYIEKQETERRAESNRGFRIQIISTQNSRLAEDIREDFEEWIQDISSPPYARTYMVFQQPYYRVRVGDYLDREKAMEFTELVRLRYPDSWVIHSQINVGRVER